MKTFSEILIDARKAKNLTQEEVADQIPMERKTYSTYESGRSEPKLKILGKIIQILEIRDEIMDLLMEQTVPREIDINLNSGLPGPSPEQLPRLLYGELRELVKAAKEIAHNTSSLHDAKKDIDEVIAKVKKDNGPV